MWKDGKVKSFVTKAKIQMKWNRKMRQIKGKGKAKSKENVMTTLTKRMHIHLK